MKNPYLSERHLLANEVDVDLDMLRTSMLYRIAGHVYSADIVTEDNSRGAKRSMKLIKKLSKPTALSHGVSHSTIFRLGARTRNRGLACGRPGHKVITEVDTISRSRPASVWATGPVSIRVRCERRSRSRMKSKTKIQGPLEIPENPLDQVEMRLAWGMHVETRLLYCMRNVGTRQCKVLKRARKAAVLGRVGDERSLIRRELATRVNGSGTWVALKHASALKKVDDGLALGE
jgi:hypothetical protein